MINKKIIFVFSFLVLYACSDFVFVYNTDDEERLNLLQNETLAIISGSDTNILRALLNKRIKENINEKYQLFVNINKKEIDLVTESNQVVTVVKIQYKTDYTLNATNNKCLVYQKNITLESSYNAKSEGYSFGSDLSKEKAEEELLQNSVDVFFDSLKIENPKLKCNE